VHGCVARGKTAHCPCLELPSLVTEFCNDENPADEGEEQKGTEKCDLCIKN